MASPPATLQRALGPFHAVLLGLGSIVGTGVFVSLAIGAGVAGPAVVLALLLAAMLAACNGLSSAQLAASHPVSGGTYEYGYQYLSPRFGFAAGWMFLCAKTASAATAALGFAGYLGHLLGIDPGITVPVALSAVVLLAILLVGGIRRTAMVNAVIVLTTLATLAVFVAALLPSAATSASTNFSGFFGAGAPGLLEATALMFVAYTGYGRIATLGEEVRDPARTIPRAIVMTLLISMLLYVSVGATAIGAIGAPAFAGSVGGSGAPLEQAVAGVAPAIAPVIAIGAMTAMLGVLLNLILGLSRVWLAMGRRGDMPKRLSYIHEQRKTPVVAVVVTSVCIAGLVLIGDVRTTWAFSAFTVLVYYSITNLAALRLKPDERRFPRWISLTGMLACLGLAFAVPIEVWTVGLGVLAVGLMWQTAVSVHRPDR